MKLAMGNLESSILDPGNSTLKPTKGNLQLFAKECTKMIERLDDFDV